MSSPFIIIQDFLSPLLCEQILSSIKVDEPNRDSEGRPIKLERHNLLWEQEIADRFRELVPEIESTYKCRYKGLEKPIFQYYPENDKSLAEQPGCENSKYIRKKWVMYKDVDLVGFVWLKDYNDSTPHDITTEVFGGKLEFPAYNFSLVPQAGTLVLFPASPHFITLISPVLLGDLYQIKLNVCISDPAGAQWFYQPKNHPGKWQDWLKDHF